MDKEKELLTAEQEEQELEALETESEEDEDETPEPTDADEDEEPPESEEDKEAKSDTKAEKRINKLTAINKSLQEQLSEAKDALEKAKIVLDRKDKVLTEERQSYKSNFETLWTRNGKLMYELSEDEFDDVIESCLNNPDPEKGKALLAEARAQRRQGKPLLKKQEEVEQGEQQLWEYEWGIITKALLDEKTGNPELKKHVDKLASRIAPIFHKRKENREIELEYLGLMEGGVKAKMKHLTDLMKELGLFNLIDNDVETPATIGKSKKAQVATKAKTFTRAQIDKMSAAEFEKNEAAIDKAMREGRIK